MPWKKGQSGNPGGRPREVGELRALARERTQEALDTLGDIMGDPKAPPAARVAASIAILDRGWGKAPAHMTIRDQREELHALTDDELAAVIVEARRLAHAGSGVEPPPSAPESDKLH